MMSWHTECRNCDYYAQNIGIIDSGLKFMKTDEFIFKVRPFVYCPYCGKRLKRINDATGKDLEEEGQLKLEL